MHTTKAAHGWTVKVDHAKCEVLSLGERRVGCLLSYVDLSVSFELVLFVDISLLAVFHVLELVDPMFESSGFMLTLLSTSQTET